MATHSIILAWEIPWTEEPGHGVTKSQTRLSDQQSLGVWRKNVCSREPIALKRENVWAGSVSLVFFLSYKSEPTRSYCTAQGTLLSITWQPRWEGGMGENGYVYKYD